jgi:hypothetical protein
MTRRLKFVFALLVACAFAALTGFFQAQMQMQQINKVFYANAFPGTNAGQQIHNCLAALGTRGGTCDATGITGNQTISANIWLGILSTQGIVLKLGNATYADSSCWTIPNDGAATPNQGSITIIGSGTDNSATGTTKQPATGTVINMSCNSGPAKIDTRGRGVMEIYGINFVDTNGDALPFIQTTNTIVKLHDNSFVGSKLGLLCDQDAIVFGGTTTTIGGASTAPFQGYGSYVERNFFDKIRRAFYGRTYVNGVVVKDNTVWVFSGSNLAGGAAIEFDGLLDNNVGNVVRDNLIEATNYVYGIKFNANGFNNTIAGNNLYDANGHTVAGVDFETSNGYNLVIAGYQQDTYPMINEVGTAVGTTTLLHAHQGQNVIFPQPTIFTSIITSQKGTVNAKNFLSTITTTHDAYWWGIGTAGAPGLGLWTDPAGGASETMVTFKRYDANQRGVFINAAVTGFFECLADCRFRAAAGSTAWLGTNTNSSAILITDTHTKFNTGVDPNGSGIKHARVSTGSVIASGVGQFTVTWGTAFADTSYTPTCSILESVAGGTSAVDLRILRLSSQTAAQIQVTVINDDTVNARTGTINCIAMHD